MAATPDGRAVSVMVHQDAWLYVSLLGQKEQAVYCFAAGRRGYRHLVNGMPGINDVMLNAGDAAKIETEQ